MEEISSLMTYEWWQLLILIISAVASLITLLYASAKLFFDKGKTVEVGNVKIGDVGKKEEDSKDSNINITINNNDEDDESAAIKKTTLAACMEDTPSFQSDLQLVAQKALQFGQDVYEKRYDLIRNQMNIAQVKVDNIKNMFLKSYVDKSKKGKYDKDSYIIFKEFIALIINNKIIFELRRAFKENHLTKYKEDDYEEYYCRDHIIRMFENLTMEIRNIMPGCITPGTDVILEIAEQNKNNIFEYLKEALIEARSISIKTEIEIQEMTVFFDKEIVSITGIKDISKRVN